MFAVGDKVMYGGTGVCTVMDINTPDIPGAVHRCYFLEPAHVSRSKIYAPVGNKNVPIRHVLTKKEAEELVAGINSLEVFEQGKDRNEMQELCRGAVKSADSYLLAKLLKTLHAKKRDAIEAKKTMPIAERDFFKTAEQMLYGELAVALDIETEEVGDYIEKHLKK